MNDLASFLQREMAMPGYAGACCRMVDRWIAQRTGASALARYGRDFETDGEVRSWLAEPGGIAVAVNRVMRACGHAKTKDPRAGDVGLVFHKGRLAMAIRTADGWISRDDEGFQMVEPQRFWKAWSLA